jgi:hypothetical protein
MPAMRCVLKETGTWAKRYIYALTVEGDTEVTDSDPVGSLIVYEREDGAGKLMRASPCYHVP